MAIQIELPPALEALTNGVCKVAVEGDDVRSALDALERRFPGTKSMVCDVSGNVRRFIHIYANASDIRFLDNLETRLGDGAELRIAPAAGRGLF
jgi:molybdopterin synthase sulfur carrier subunit